MDTRSSLGRLTGPFHHFITLARRWRQRARTRLALARLDPRLLCDIGLGEQDRRRECAKWFYER